MNQPKCNTCLTNLENLGKIGLRTGGMDGSWQLLIGDWADIQEKVIYLDSYRCNKCGRLEFFDFDSSLPFE
jgi:hypothetical protein